MRWTQHALSAGAIVAFAYCGFVLIYTWSFQNVQRRQLDRLLAARQVNHGGRQNASRSLPRNTAGAVLEGLIGRIEVPRLGVSAIVMEGVDTLTLRRAGEHIPGSALPGQPGNVGISGHRDTLFRPLRNVRQNDIITLTTLLGEFSYQVVSTRIVGPQNITVLDGSRKEILTLVTCYPFYFVGPAPNRFIVRAERVRNAS